jgi:hypothetical protein
MQMMRYNIVAEATGKETTMVSSYLICDACGQFGPPASFLSENGLRLCYRCWYQERLNGEPSAENETEPVSRPPPDPERSDQPDEE